MNEGRLQMDQEIRKTIIHQSINNSIETYQVQSIELYQQRIRIKKKRLPKYVHDCVSIFSVPPLTSLAKARIRGATDAASPPPPPNTSSPPPGYLVSPLTAGTWLRESARQLSGPDTSSSLRRLSPSAPCLHLMQIIWK